jgi:adenine-specific DNA methylase
MIDQGASIAQLGVASAIVVILLVVLKWARDDLKEARSDIRALMAAKDADQKALLPALTLSTSAINDMATALEKLSARIERLFEQRPSPRNGG